MKYDFIVNKTWYLNERHYGSLTGLNKEETKQKIGESLFLKYRRSWDIAPPRMEKNDKNISLFGSLNKTIPGDKVPNTESLKDTHDRVIKYYNETISNIFKKNNVVIIVAHGNSLRALCKYLFKLNNKQIINLEIPTGNPLVIQLDQKYEIKNSKYQADK